MRTLFLSDPSPRQPTSSCLPPPSSRSLLLTSILPSSPARFKRYIIKVLSILDFGSGKVLNGTGEAEFQTRYCGYPIPLKTVALSAAAGCFVVALLTSKS